jgi:hypothetical protein
MQALSFIKGPMVNDWAAEQVHIVMNRATHQNNPIEQDEEEHWREFETAFNNSFTNSAKRQEAHKGLKNIYCICKEMTLTAMLPPSRD